MKFAIIAAGAALIGATAAFADHDDAHKEGAYKKAEGWEAKVEAHFKAVDANADGAVTEAEMIDYATARAREDFAAAANGDASVTLAEAKAHHKAKHDAMMKEHGEHKAE